MVSSDYFTLLSTITQNCIVVRVRAINRVITAIYDEALRPFKIKASQMNILVAIAALQTARPSDLCRLLHMDPSTLSRNVERMKKRGWLKTGPAEDGRGHVLMATRAGVQLIARAYAAWEEAQEKASSMLGSEGLKSIMAMGDRLLGIGAADR